MQKATRASLVLGGIATFLLVASPSAASMVAAAENDLQATPADTLVHVVGRGDNLHLIAIGYREQAGYYSLSDCLDAILAARRPHESDLLRPGDRVLVPVQVAPVAVRAANPTLDGADLRALYLPGVVCARETVFERVDRFVTSGGNGVVFDAKDIDGGVTYRSQHEFATHGRGCTGPMIPRLGEFVARLHDRDLWVVARLALFLDGELGRQRPDLALADSTGAPWQERGCVWMDPGSLDVRDYNVYLALELANAGVNEIQIDYVRFPTNGWLGDWQGDEALTAARRRDVITSFVATLHGILEARGCRLSADIFGIAAWGRTADEALTGQHIPSLAPHLDVICPMIYPSHFGPGFEGLEWPADHPETVVAAGVQRCRELAGDDLLVRPWLQAFAWRVNGYDSDYVRTQIRAAVDAGASGWSLWNPAGRYEIASAALMAP